jgi:hypothetical protein
VLVGKGLKAIIQNSNAVRMCGIDPLPGCRNREPSRWGIENHVHCRGGAVLFHHEKLAANIAA